MYYFLAITLESDVKNGYFWPSYVLCKSWTTSEKRSGWQIIHWIEGVPTRNLPKILVTEPVGHEDMIQFMSSYQKTDPVTRKHFHPRGSLCWFSCNQYGDPTGTTIFIKKVPEWRYIFDFSNRGYQQLKRERERVREANELLTSDVWAEQMKFTDIKMRLHQKSHNKDLEEWRKKNGRKRKARKNECI